MSDLINTLETPGEFDALTTLRPNEPYFLLVGRDKLAPELVSAWADKNRRRALADFEREKINAERLGRELRKSTQAEMIAASMIEFKNGWRTGTVKVEQKAATYTGHQLPEETKRSDRLQSGRVRAASAINNAVAEVVDLLHVLGDWDDAELDALAVIARDVRDRMQTLSDAVKPQRPKIGEAA